MTAASAQFHNVYGYMSERNAEARRRLEALARLLDSAVRVPGTDIRVGLDPVLNLIPGVGTLIAKGMAAYLIWEARRLGVSNSTMLRMIGHVGIDLMISWIPVVGWVGDVFYRANIKNIELLREHLDRSDGVIDAAVKNEASGNEPAGRRR
ncbi:DUF4112 domain-containing protein [uncultured Ferrovibrio sp.]|jgi:hypothetical protein|uniref:DUF4112 domain-containing protein n=1 Tax=uncultured Ferrovibrio sp. TaxID=1576913 RepID=UPI002633DA7C|nr:DUF4112 domain-containing protein [uncultured Ferrovibrio sp.]